MSPTRQRAAAKLGISPDKQVNGFALTQFGGTVTWDRVGAETSNDPANDTTQSLTAWWKSQKGKDQPGVSGPVAVFIKEGPEAKRTDAEKEIRAAGAPGPLSLLIRLGGTNTIRIDASSATSPETGDGR